MLTTSKKVFGKAKSMPVGLAVGTIVALAITVVFAIIITQLVLGEQVGEMAIGYGAMLVLPAASAVSSLLSVAMIKRRRMQVCMMASGLYLACLALINLLLFGGQFSSFVLTCLLVLGASLAVGISGLMGEKGTKKAGRKRRYR